MRPFFICYISGQGQHTTDSQLSDCVGITATTVLDAENIWMFGQLGCRDGFNVVLGPRRDIVKIGRFINAISHFTEMVNQPFLGAADEIRGTARASTPTETNSLPSSTVS